MKDQTLSLLRELTRAHGAPGEEQPIRELECHELMMEDYGVSLGDPIVPDTEMRILQNLDRLMAKAFDNRVGVGLLVQALQQLNNALWMVCPSLFWECLHAISILTIRSLISTTTSRLFIS